MTGLIDIFWRHFVFLTNSIEIEVKSRPYWPGGGEQGQVQGEGLQGHRPGPEGGTWDCGRALHPDPTHSSPCRASGARSAGSGLRFQAGWVVPGIALPVPTPYTRPWYHTQPVPYPARTPVPVHVRHAGTDCSNTRFDLGVGEPRVVEHTRISRVLTVFSTTRVLTVLHGIMTETRLWDGLSSEACGRSYLRSYSGQF